MAVGLALVFMAAPAAATRWPNAGCPDSLTISHLRDPAAACHPGIGDSLFTGIRGIVTARDTRTSGVGFWLQNSAGGPYSGIRVFTANTNWPVLVGDSVTVVPSMLYAYSSESELTSLSGSFGGNFACAVLAHDQTLPACHEGTPATFNHLATNTGVEPWEGCLVRCLPSDGQGPLRVACVSSTAYMVVDSACTSGVCDSVLVDVSTIPNPALGVPAPGTTMLCVQGVVGQGATGYCIRVRDENDGCSAGDPCTVAYAYAITDDSVRVVFDRSVTPASAGNTANYSLASLGTVNSATLEAGGTAVMLDITNGLAHGVTETVTVRDIVAAVSGRVMTTSQSVTFWNGLTTIAEIQAPEATALAASPCEDRSRFAGTGSAVGDHQVTFRGVCTAAFPGALYYVEEAVGGVRSGIGLFAPMNPLTVGNQYLVVAGVEEYYGETEATASIYLRDEGAGTVPAAILQTVGVLADASCDAGATLSTGEDYEGVLVRLCYVMAIEDAGGPGYGFDVAGPRPSWDDTIHVRNVQSLTAWSYQADSGAFLDITGIETFSYGVFQVAPRSDDDLDILIPLINVPGETPQEISLGVVPNPGRLQEIRFSLPAGGQAEVGIYDAAGRRVVVLARGNFPAGSHARRWDGRDSAGRSVRPGIYFCRLSLGDVVRVARVVRVE